MGVYLFWLTAASPRSIGLKISIFSLIVVTSNNPFPISGLSNELYAVAPTYYNEVLNYCPCKTPSSIQLQ